MNGDASESGLRQLEEKILRLERANRQLAESNAHLRATLNAGPDCVMVFDAGGSVLEINAAGLRMLEAESVEQLQRRGLYSLITEPHRAAVRSVSEKVMGGGRGTLEFEVEGLQGGRRWLEVHASPLRDDSGVVVAMMAFFHDISDRKNAERSLAASQERQAHQLSELEELYRIAPVGMALVDRDLRFVRVNERLAAMDGCTPSEHIGRTLEEVLPKLSGGLTGIFQRVLDTAEPSLDIEIDVSAPAAPGAEGHWLASYLPVQDGAGQVVGVSAIVVDVTALKEAERVREALLGRERDARQQVHRILESVTDAFVALDTQWRYTYVNRRAGEIFNRDPEYLIGKHIWTEFPEGVGQPFHEAYEKAVAEQVPQTIEAYYPPYDSWFENRIYPHPDGLSIVFQDITERKRAEQALAISERRLQEAQRIGRLGDWDFYFASGKIVWSPQVFAMYGRDPALGPPSLDEALATYDPESRVVVEDALARLKATGEQQEYELCARLPDGSPAYYCAVAVPILDAEGSIVGVRGIVQDVTSRKRAELSLWDSEQRFHAFMDAMPAIAWVKDAEGRYVYMNRAWEETFKLKAADWLGKTEADLIPPALAEKLRARDLEVLRTGNALPPMEEVSDVGAGHFHWQSIKFPLQNQSGERFVGDLAIDLTEVKRTEEALRRTQSRLTLAADASNTGLWDWDLKSNDVYFSPVWKRQLGYADDEIENRIEELRSRVHPDDADAVLARINAYLECPAGEFENEFRMRHKDGSDRWILAKASLLRDERGQPARMLGAHIDITGRKDAEAALARSEHRLRRIMDGLGPHLFIGLLDAAGALLMASRSIMETTEFGDELVIGKFLPETYWWSYSDAVSKRLAHAIERVSQGEAVRYDERVRVGDASFIWVDFSLQPLRDEAGVLTGMVPSASVITDRKQAEEALHAREALLTLIYENVDDVVFLINVTDEGFRFASVNPRFLAATGLASAQVVGRRVEDVIPAGSLPEVRKQYAHAVRSGRPVHWEEETIYPSGTKYGEVTVAPILDGTGRCTQLIGTVHDVTGRKHAEKQMREAALRQQALTRRLAEVQEVEQRRLSTELHDRIGQNLTALSINLNIIGSRNSPMAAAATSERLQDSRRLLESTIASVRDLISELRPPALEDYGLLAGLRWFGDQFQKRTGLQVSVQGNELSPRLPLPLEGALFRIAQEALNNAAKHAHATRAVLTLHRESGRVSLEIADDGCGFDISAAHRDPARPHWGLQMMAERAEAVDARLRIESSLADGTRITVVTNPVDPP